MKLKLAGIASSVWLLLAPLGGVIQAVNPPILAQAANVWDADTNQTNLSDYDQLLQNAGPSDGIVDWYPARDAVGADPRGQELVKQLIELSQATNNANSNARSVLFNGTTGSNDQDAAQRTYERYQLAFGFIAQILAFNNEKTGLGAKLAQGAVRGDDPVDQRTGESVISPEVSKAPRVGQGQTLADVLGKAFFGNAADAYAQIYLNGYDNVAQNEANIIREATSSLTIVAVSKLTGRKATAIFKLNNKTLPRAPENVRLNNYKDDSAYALDQQNGNGDIAGLNMMTAPQSAIDNIKFSRESTFWVDGNGDGTIVVPRGTTAKQIAQLIAQKKLASNNSLQESAPMKAIQAVNGTDKNGELYENKTNHLVTHSYNHLYAKGRYAKNNGGDVIEEFGHANITPAKYANAITSGALIRGETSDEFNHAAPIPFGINGPNCYDVDTANAQYTMKEYNNLYNGESGLGDSDVKLRSQSRQHLADATTPFYVSDQHATKDAWFGGTEPSLAGGSGHMLDTDSMPWSIAESRAIPEVERSEGTPYKDDGSVNFPDYMKNGLSESSKTAAVSAALPNANTNVGRVQHLFSPKPYFKEAYDANHFVTNSPAFQNPGADQIAQEILNNGSFSGNTTEAKVRRSFTYEAPASAWVYKSYNNPYSTVMSSAGAQTVDGKPLSPNGSNSTIQPQKHVDINNYNNTDPDPSDINQVVSTDTGGKAFVKQVNVSDGYPGPTEPHPSKTFLYLGVYNYDPGTGKYKLTVPTIPDEVPSRSSDPLLELEPGDGGTIYKFGAVGIDGENDTNTETGAIKVLGYSHKDSVTSDLNNSDLGPKNDLTSWPLIRRSIAFYRMNQPTGGFQKLADPYNKLKVVDDGEFFVQVWDKNTYIKDEDGKPTADPQPLIYNQNAKDSDYNGETLGKVDSPNFEAKYFLIGTINVKDQFDGDLERRKETKVLFGDHLAQTAPSKRAYFNSNLYNNPKGAFSHQGSHANHSRYFVSQDFSIGPVSTDMINNAGPAEAKVDIPSLGEVPAVNNSEEDAAKILKLAVMYNNPKSNDANKSGNGGQQVVNEFTDTGADSNGYGNDGSGYKLVSIAEAAAKQGTSEEVLANEVAKVTGKTSSEVKNTKWVEATLPRLKRNAGKARINVVVYDQADTAVLAPTKAETKPSFSTTDRVTGNDPFNPQFQPYTTTYDDGAVLKGADVPQSFQNLLQNTLVAGNPDLVNHPMRLEQVLVSAFLNSWQQNAKSVSQTANSSNSPSALYLAGGFGISNSDTKNSYSQWPNGYATNSGDYLTAISHFTGDFYRGGTDLQLVRGGTVKGIPASALKADVSKVDLSQAGTYPVVYTYTNPANAKDSASITVFVNVKASAAPVFAFQGGSDVALHVGESFDRNDYKVVGNWQIFNRAGGDYAKLTNGEGIATGSDGKPQVTITGAVDVQTPGVYQVTYEATNLAGVKAKMVRNITVLPNGASSDWTITDLKSVGYINYTPGYGINVWNAPAGTFTGQRLLHGTSWKIFQKAVNRQGQVYYNVGQNQWLDGQYLSFTPVSTLQPLNGVVTINYVPGYGVNLWKNASASGGYYKRKLPHGSKWRVMGQQNGFYNVGKNQWIQAKFAKFQAH